MRGESEQASKGCSLPFKAGTSPEVHERGIRGPTKRTYILKQFLSKKTKNMNILLTNDQAYTVSYRENTDVNRERHAPIVFLNHHLKIYRGILVLRTNHR